MREQRHSPESFMMTIMNEFPVLFWRQPVCWSSVPRGWRKIVWDMCDKLEGLAYTGDDSLLIAQIKEKFGTLRVYIDSGSEEARAIIKECEKASWSTCMCCGDSGATTHNDGWITTLCDRCRKVREKDRMAFWKLMRKEDG